MNVPVHTLKRVVTNWGFGHALAVEVNGERRWNLIDAYGELSDWGDPLRDDDYVDRWENVYFPDEQGPALALPDPVPLHTLMRVSGDIHALRCGDDAERPWLLFEHGVVSGRLVGDFVVANAVCVYVPRDSTQWAIDHGLNPNPNPGNDGEIETW